MTALGLDNLGGAVRASLSLEWYSSCSMACTAGGDVRFIPFHTPYILQCVLGWGQFGLNSEPALALGKDRLIFRHVSQVLG